MLIDAHCHLWSLGRNGQSWPTPDLGPIYRDFGLKDLALTAPALTGAVLVQSQPCEDDTAWLLRIAAAEPLVLGVVGWTDMAASDAEARIAALASDRWLKGLRPMLQDLPVDWILDRALEPAIGAMVAADLTFDALVRPRHLQSLLELARRWPDLRVVIDHAAKPEIAAGRLEPWREQMSALADLSNVHCKLSGLLTEAGEVTGLDAVAPYVAHLVTGFGPDRLMWGSDWPVLKLAGEYGDWRALCEALVPAQLHAAVFSQTARRVYRL
ncbi:MAG: amidohydrolase family protein [Caulobacter sp.]|nr:amidohydrolase family protein [Caulobacter sp.]